MIIDNPHTTKKKKKVLKLKKKVGDRFKNKRKKSITGLTPDKAKEMLKKNKEGIVITLNEDSDDVTCRFFGNWKDARKYIRASVSEEHLIELMSDHCVATYVDLLGDDCEINDHAVHIKANMAFGRFLGDEFNPPHRRKLKPTFGKKRPKLGPKKQTGKTKPVGDTIKLQDLVENTFEARRILRAARDKGTITHTNSRWEWEKKDPMLEKVKKLLEVN